MYSLFDRAKSQWDARNSLYANSYSKMKDAVLNIQNDAQITTLLSQQPELQTKFQTLFSCTEDPQQNFVEPSQKRKKRRID
jgi:hypothetical protein